MIRHVILLAVVALLCSAALPLWAMTGCAMTSEGSGAHSCCHRHPAPVSAPSGACVLHCSGSVGVLAKAQPAPQPEPATDAHEAAIGSHDGPVSVAAGLAPAPIEFDSSGLFLRVRVLRI